MEGSWGLPEETSAALYLQMAVEEQSLTASNKVLGKKLSEEHSIIQLQDQPSEIPSLIGKELSHASEHDHKPHSPTMCVERVSEEDLTLIRE